MMTEISTEKYPVFKQRIYKNPHGGIIPKLWGDASGNMGTNLGSKVTPWGNVNKRGAELLLECNGEKTVGDIIAQVYGEESDKARDPILEYFKDVSLRLNMEFCDSPSSCKAKSYGTFECYYPMAVQGEVTTRCNLNCQHCSNASGRGGVDMKKEDYLRIVDMLSDAGTLTFAVTGGEPFVRKDVLEIVEKCCNTFYDVHIATNGTLIGEKEAAALAEFSNLSVIVSLDSHTSQFHDKFRQVEGAFDRALSGIRNLVSEGIYTLVGATFVRENINHFKEVLFLAEELMVDGVNYDIARPTGRGEDIDISAEEDMLYMEEINTILDETFTDRMMTVFCERFRTSYMSNCGVGMTMWCFAPTGNVRPCSVLNEKYVTCGNLLREDFHEIFSREPATILNRIRAPCKEMCGDCRYLSYCSECICNGILMYKRIGDTCIWGAKTKVDEWVNPT
jgi:radical SAM protein with 4Fe4S-binding SPASM domain